MSEEFEGNVEELQDDDELYMKYFKTYATEDVNEIITACTAASTLIYNRFRIKFDHPELVGTSFSIILETIINKLKILSNEYSDFAINICNQLEIGYTPGEEDEDDEKQGNFMIFIRHKENSSKKDENFDSTMSQIQRCVQWNTDNIQDNPKILREISIEALENLKKYKINFGKSEIIWPIFITVYESLVSFLKTSRLERNDFEFEINFMGCFYIGCREEEDGDSIYIRPNIQEKLLLKDDAKFSSKNE